MKDPHNLCNHRYPGSIRKNDSIIARIARRARARARVRLGLGLRAIRNKDAITSSRMESFFRIDPDDWQCGG